MPYGKKYRSKWSRYNFIGRNINRFKRFGAGLAGGALGYIGGNFPGAFNGYSYGASLVPKYRRVKGKHLFKSNPGYVGSNPGHRFGSNPGHIIGSNPSGPIVVPAKGRKRMVEPMLHHPGRKFKFARKRIF